jgi:hypothetical protein
MIGQQGNAGSSSSIQLRQHEGSAAAAGEDEGPDTPSSWAACGTVTVLHAAAAAGNRVLLEFLLQNGASGSKQMQGGAAHCTMRCCTSRLTAPSSCCRGGRGSWRG